MAQKHSYVTSTTLIETTPEAAPTPPPWFAEAVVVLTAVRASALYPALYERLRVARGRTGLYVALDFVLLLVTFAVSDAFHLRGMFTRLPPVASALAAVWDRTELPSRPALSRFLQALRPAHVATLSKLLLDDLIDAGIPAEQMGGLFDRDGTRTIVFDDDGTYHGARQRSLAEDASRPEPIRRAASLCARGYHGGSRRADVTRTRTALQQAHTQEWLGCWSAPGNGHPFAQLEDAAAAVVHYLAARGLSAAQGLLRLDGLYGYARVAATISRYGVGYLMRCVDYRLLRLRIVQEVLATPAHATYQAPDSPVVREAWQVLALPWTAAKDPTQTVVTRLIVTRRPASEKGKERIGKKRGDWVYELFVTDRSATGWAIEDVLSFYFARGGFEGTLAQEDRERDLDRTVSWHPAGQQFWTLLGQLVWNLRLRLGVSFASAPARWTQWAPARDNISDTVTDVASPSASPAPMEAPTEAAPAPAEAPAEAVPAPAEAPSVAVPPETSTSPTRGRIAPAAGRGAGRFGGADFVWTPEGHLRCPEGELLRRVECRREPHHLRVIYSAAASACAVCAEQWQCRGRPRGSARGRRVSVLEPLPCHEVAPSCQPVERNPVDTPRAEASGITIPVSAPSTPRPPPLGPGAVWWQDLEACRYRRELREHLRAQRVDVGPTPIILVAHRPPYQSRDERAHRRTTWKLQAERNRRSPDAGRRILVHGIPPSLDELLGLPSRFASAA